jgi:hypothetical protein
MRTFYHHGQALNRRSLQDNAGVIVNPKGEMKGSAITGPVAKECVRALLFPTLEPLLNVMHRPTSGRVSPRTRAPSSDFLLSCSSPALMFLYVLYCLSMAIGTSVTSLQSARSSTVRVYRRVVYMLCYSGIDHERKGVVLSTRPCHSRHPRHLRECRPTTTTWRSTNACHRLRIAHPNTRRSRSKQRPRRKACLKWVL